MNTLFVSMSRYPEGDSADVLRLINIISLFKQNNSNVFVISRGDTTDFQRKGHQISDYISFRSRKNSSLQKLIDIILFTARLREFLKHSDMKWNRIVIDVVPNSTVKYLKKYAKQRNIQIIVDCVEWFSKEEYRLGRFNYEYVSQDYLIKKLIDKQFYVISISSYLEKYFRSRGIKTIRIPVILDIENIKYKKRNASSKIVVIYAGSPGGKDALDVMIKGFELLSDREKTKIEFRIIGVDWKWIKRRYHFSKTRIDKMKNYICVYGRVDRSQVHNYMEEADFSILLRPENLRYAKAGFPTKIVESLANGTPVICNLTSDLDKYIRENYNGKIVSECTAQSLCETLKEILKMERQQILGMGSGARKSAEVGFDTKRYASKFNKFLNAD